MKNERHSYISRGVSREAFQDVAVKHTSDDDSLEWYLHNHAHSDTRCNEECQVVRSGKVEFVPQMDAAHSSSDV